MSYDPIVLQTTVFLAAVTGVFVNIMFPYWQKIRESIEGGDFKFEYKYLGIGITSAITAIVISFTLFDSLLTNVDTTATLGAIFIQVALTAFGVNAGAKMLVHAADQKALVSK